MTYYIGNKWSVMKAFQAKNIQEILEIPKHRYDYILMKIGVKPEIEQASGRGKTNLFSLSNLLDFAIANAAMNLGMGPEMIRSALQHIHLHCKKFFSKSSYLDQIFYHVAADNDFAYYMFTGEVSSAMSDRHLYKYPKGYSSETNPFPLGDDDEGIDGIPGYCTLNLTFIKYAVLLKL